ncbi:MAG: hypothetical protein K2N26_06975 [Oscillospiraceae bacterium]|nr:hypothetical protein [Oscillospiraceae bacterium]
MTNYSFFAFEPVTLAGTIINIALLGGLIYLAVRIVRTVLKKTEDKDDKQ